MRIKNNGQRIANTALLAEHNIAPDCGFARAQRVIAFCNGTAVTQSPRPVQITRRKHRHFDPIDAFVDRFIGAYGPADQWSHAH